MLEDAPDDARVMVEIENHVKPGMFAFADACECDTGLTDLGINEEGDPGGEIVFLVMAHGRTASADGALDETYGLN